MKHFFDLHSVVSLVFEQWLNSSGISTLLFRCYDNLQNSTRKLLLLACFLLWNQGSSPTCILGIRSTWKYILEGLLSWTFEWPIPQASDSYESLKTSHLVCCTRVILIFRCGWNLTKQTGSIHRWKLCNVKQKRTCKSWNICKWKYDMQRKLKVRK